MEPITVAIFFLYAVIIGEENRTQDAVIQAQAEQLNRLSVSHSAVAAREITNHDMQQRQIDALIRQALTENE